MESEGMIKQARKVQCIYQPASHYSIKDRRRQEKGGIDIRIPSLHNSRQKESISIKQKSKSNKHREKAMCKSCVLCWFSFFFSLSMPLSQMTLNPRANVIPKNLTYKRRGEEKGKIIIKFVLRVVVVLRRESLVVHPSW
jgi:hypothetical protein